MDGDRDDISEAELGKKLLQVGGAHMPEYYDFGGGASKPGDAGKVEEVRAGAAVPGGKGWGAPEAEASDTGGGKQEEGGAVDAAGATEAAPAAKVAVTDETALMLTNEGGEQKVGAAGGVAGDQQVRVSVVASDPDATAAESPSELEARIVALAQKLAKSEAHVRTLQAQVAEMMVREGGQGWSRKDAVL
jgi:hypothetical protein